MARDVFDPFRGANCEVLR